MSTTIEADSINQVNLGIFPPPYVLVQTATYVCIHCMYMYTQVSAGP